MDPFTISVGTNVVANLVTRLVESGPRRFTQTNWEKTDELGRLFYLIEEQFGDELPELKHSDLDAVWRQDSTFIDALQGLTVTGNAELLHPELVEAIEPMIGGTAEWTPREAATRLASAIPALLGAAKQGNDKVLYAIREFEVRNEALVRQSTAQLTRMESHLARHATPTVILTSDWPDATEEALTRAAKEDPDGLSALNRALNGKDRGLEAARLARTPRSWMEPLQACTWELLAVLCEEGGTWEEARDSWLQAREKPGADYADYSVRGAEAAMQAGDAETAVQLLDEARVSDPQSARVLLQDALRLGEPAEELDALDAITTTQPGIVAMVHIAKANAWLALEDIPAAKANLLTASATGAGSTISYRMAEKSVAAAEVFAQPHPDAQVLERLATESLQLETELFARRQYPQAASMRAQAANFHGLGGDFDTARQLVSAAVAAYEAVEHPAARVVLAMEAAHLQQLDVVVSLLRPDETGPRSRYLRAVAKTEGTDDEKRAAATELEQLLTEDDVEVRSLAALRRLELAGEAEGIEWQDDADAIVSASSIAPSVVYRAKWLAARGREVEAEQQLLAHSDEMWALSQLMRLAGRLDDWPKAARYAAALLDHEPDWLSRLAAAQAFGRAGDLPRAEAEFTRLADHADVPVTIRAAAHRELLNSRFGAGHVRALELAERWLELEPGNVDAAWVRVHALALLGHDAVAFSRIEEQALRPRTTYESRLTAQLYLQQAEPLRALRKVIALADEEDLPDERLEVFIVVAAMRVDNLPQELYARVSYERFKDVFPESEALQSRSLDEFIQYLEHDVADRARHIESVQKQLFEQGDVPTVVLAALTQNDIGSLWLRMSWTTGLPIGYGSAQLEDLERDDARKALTGPAVWDIPSVFIVDHVLPSNTGERVRKTLPGSVIVQSGLADIAEGKRRLIVESGSERRELGYNLAEGKPEFRDWDPALIEEDDKRAHAALAFAQMLKVIPDKDPQTPQEGDTLLDEAGSNSFRSLLALIGASTRLGLPIFSDDRDVRRRAREGGLAAFGSLAMLDVLHEAGHLTPEERLEARRALLRSRAFGVRPTVEELVRFAEECSWQVSEEAAVALVDIDAWRSVPASTFNTWLDFLRVVHDTAPKELAAWVVHVLQGMQEALPHVPLSKQAENFVVMALMPNERNTHVFVRALVRALDRARLHFSVSLGDPPLRGFLTFLGILAQGAQAGHYEPEPAGIFAGRAWTKFGLNDQLRLLPLIFA